jgi:hypothetical protein
VVWLSKTQDRMRFLSNKLLSKTFADVRKKDKIKVSSLNVVKVKVVLNNIERIINMIGRNKIVIEVIRKVGEK